MERYVFRIRQRDDGGWTASCSAFNIAVDADAAEDAVRALKGLVEDAGRRTLLEGSPLPAGHTELEGDFSVPSGERLLICEFAMSEAYAAGKGKPVRRSVSLPEWLDNAIRSRGIDASRLFQDAAIRKIKEMDMERSGVRKVSDWRELEDACAPGVLDGYLEHCLGEMLKAHRDMNGDKEG